MKTTISAVISAYNEEKKIEECLQSVAWTDEIVVVDNASTDKTVSIAKKYTSKIFSRPNNPMLNINKNFGFSKATGDWILSLDADERVTKELKEEILSTLNSQFSTQNGYWIPRKNIIFGKWIEHAGWYPDHQLRFFRKGKGKFPEKHVHEMIDVGGNTKYLTSDIVHYNYDTVSQFIQKMNTIYVSSEADGLFKNGYVFDWKDAIRFPTKEFLSRFFARAGYKDGLHGLMLSLFMAFYHFVVFATLWERQGFTKVDDPDLLEKTQKEFTKTHKEIFFWFRTEEIKKTNNALKKIWFKILHRLR